MRRGFLTAAMALLWALSVGPALAVSFTEGVRPQVQGSSVVAPTDANNQRPGFDLTPGSALSFGGPLESIDLHGRIVGASDFFRFTALSDFTVSFIFGGYTQQDGTIVASSGFVDDPAAARRGSISDFSLSLLDGVGNVTSSQVIADLASGITAGNAFLFSGGPGSYSFGIEGQTDAALYDIRIQAASQATTVPLPASLPILLAGLAGLGLAARRGRHG